MSTQGLWEVLTPTGELEKAGNWRFIGRLQWKNRKPQETRKKLTRTLNSRILRVEASYNPSDSRQVKRKFYKAGFIHQFVDGVEAYSEFFPFGESYVVFPLQEDEYRVEVWLNRWLSNAIVKVYEYTGPFLVNSSQDENLTQSDTWFPALRPEA